MLIPRITETWIMTQTWEHLLFAHWPVSAKLLRPLIPDELQIDTWHKQAWVSAVAFFASDVRIRVLPMIPLTSGFPQLNLRTYVTVNGRPGVFFLALEVPHPLVVPAVRLLYRLPCRRADMSMSVTPPAPHVRFRSRRLDEDGAHVFEAEYEPASPPFQAKAGSLDRWLTERYRLAASLSGTGTVYTGDIAHPPWSLQYARADLIRITASPVPLPPAPALLHYARQVRANVTGAKRPTDFRLPPG